MVSIVLTSTQVRQIIEQEQQNAPAPVDPGIPSERPATYVPPPAQADYTVTFESLWQLPFLSNNTGGGVAFNGLLQSGWWDIRIIRASDNVVMGATKWSTQHKIRLNNLGDEKARWAGQGYADIRAKLDALQNVEDSDLMWFPERIRYEVIYDQPWVPDDYILEVTDDRGQVYNVTFTQGATLPEYAVFYSAQAGATRNVYCVYKM